MFRFSWSRSPKFCPVSSRMSRRRSVAERDHRRPCAPPTSGTGRADAHYCCTRKNLSGMRRAAVAHNLHDHAAANVDECEAPDPRLESRRAAPVAPAIVIRRQLLHDYKFKSRNSRRRIFPVAVFGRSSRNSIERGYLYAAICSLQNPISSSSVTAASGLSETYAFTVSPR